MTLTQLSHEVLFQKPESSQQPWQTPSQMAHEVLTGWNQSLHDEALPLVSTHSWGHGSLAQRMFHEHRAGGGLWAVVGSGLWQIDQSGPKKATLGLCEALGQDTPGGVGLKAQEGHWPKRRAGWWKLGGLACETRGWGGHMEMWILF